ncbi:hypothetical protein Patl1_13490 [Pistacia atlantica]|uniref:Uncharacterized protein n=1 Tax=Pistacia atlantica TaxID=434234 RepID=A0ACC1AVJ4_9ROSI|nr:hypothetical protein Patl1_13490 [Pistacia atlantica]
MASSSLSFSILLCINFGYFNGSQCVMSDHILLCSYWRKESENVDDDQDFRAVEDGFVAVTPFSLSSTMQSEIQTLVSDWIVAAKCK